MSLETKTLDVVGTGSMVLDEISYVPRLLGSDGKMLIHQDANRPAVRRLPGGVTLNHLGWAACLGLRTGIFGKQADDEAGRLLREAMDALGIERSIDCSGSVSSTARVYVDDTQQRAIYMARGATAELTPDEVTRTHAALLSRARIVTSEISQVSLCVVERSFRIARANDALTVLDFDVPAAEAVPALGSNAELRAVLELADVIKVSRGSLMGLSSHSEPEDQAREMARSLGSSAVIVTLGRHGALLHHRSQSTRSPGHAVEVIDPTGAGDAFLGGMLYGLAREPSWAATLTFNNPARAAY